MVNNINTKIIIFFMSFSFLIGPQYLMAKENNVMETVQKENYFYDANHVRYELYKTNGGQDYNWLFVPGGPGADSSYFHSLIDILDLPGNVWLIDLPGVGSNVSDGVSTDFDTWFEVFPSTIKRFNNPILVGHSFGGSFPLLFPELEHHLKGFILLNSTPSLWMEAAAEYAKQFDVPDLTKEMQAFTQKPCQQTFDVALNACMPYYFPKETLEQGREMLLQVPFQYLAAVWWQTKAIELNFTAKWIPQKVPTLIIGSKYDCICPFSLFEEDKRFDRDNVKLLFIENAGHLIWLENPDAAREAFESFVSGLSPKES